MEHEFKARDWVTIKGKTLDLSGTGLNVGDVKQVSGVVTGTGIRDSYITLIGKEQYCFNPSDLEPYTGKFICDHAGECKNLCCINRKPQPKNDIIYSGSLFERPSGWQCGYLYGDHDPGRTVIVKAIPYTEEPMEEKAKYEAVKDFSIYDFILAHQQNYGWKEFEHSCSQFKQDITVCEKNYNSDIALHINTLAEDKNISDEFIPHLIKYDLIRKVEPEMFYKVGDRLQFPSGTIVRIIGDNRLISLMIEESANFPKYHIYYERLFPVKDCRKITKADIEKITSFRFTKI